MRAETVDYNAHYDDARFPNHLNQLLHLNSQSRGRGADPTPQGMATWADSQGSVVLPGQFSSVLRGEHENHIEEIRLMDNCYHAPKRDFAGENIVLKTARMYSGKTRYKHKRPRPPRQGEVIAGKTYQIPNLKEEIYSMKPAMVTRHSANFENERLTSLNSSQGRRQMKQLYLNENFNFASNKTLSNCFSSQAMRRSLREQGLQEFDRSPKSGDSRPQSNEERSRITQTNSYNRRLMTQRFTHRGVTADQSSLKFSDVTKINAFPHLDLKRDRSGETEGIIIQEQRSGLGTARVFMRQIKTRQQTGVLKHTDTSHKLSLLNYDRHDATQTEAQRHGSRGKSGHLLDFDNYEALSDENCIVRNSYNIVRTSGDAGESLRSSMNGKVMFKVVSPKKKKGGFTEDESSEQTRDRDALSDETTLEYGPDGTINQRAVTQEEQDIDGFRDFITIPEYLERYNRLKRRRRKNPGLQLEIRPNDFIILNHIYPRVYSINNEIKGTLRDPKVEFNPVSMSQDQIYLVKSVSYLHSRDFQRAQYFIDGGIAGWPSATFEFRFNEALMFYLQGDYSKSVHSFRALIEEAQKDCIQEVSLSRLVSVLLNFALSLLKDSQNRYKEIVDIQQHPAFAKIRMMTHPCNIKLQKLIKYSQTQLLKQRQSQRTSYSETRDVSPLAPEKSSDDDDSSLEAAEIGTAYAVEKKIKYQTFTKHGVQDFAYKNIKSLKAIRDKKMAERETVVSARNAEQTRSPPPVVKSEEGDQSAREKYQRVLKVHKAAFMNVNKIQDTRSPDYVLSMSDIISRLSQKDDIQKNKTLMFQLKKLDEIIKQSSNAPSETQPLQQPAKEMIPFPKEKTDQQKRNPLYSEDDEQTSQAEQKRLLETCLRNLGELRLEMCMEYGGEFEKIDPVLDEYKVLCNSIYALLKEENLMDIIRSHTQRQRKEHARAGKAPKDNAKNSVAKDILVSALLKGIEGPLTVESQGNDQMVEIEILKGKMKQLREEMALACKARKLQKSGDYMDQIEKDITKMILVARRKQREREKHQRQEEEARLMSTSDVDVVLSDQEIIATQALIHLLKRPKYQEMVSDRFKVDNKRFKESLVKPQSDNQKTTFKSGHLTRQVLKSFKHVDPDQYSKLHERSQAFLSYLIDTFGAYFIAQRSYCLTEIFDVAPQPILKFFENAASIMTTIPLKFETSSMQQAGDICGSEFIYNKGDLLYRLISEALMQPKVMEYMGLDKPEWLIEVTQKFNMLGVINFIFREGIEVFRRTKEDGPETEPDLEEEDEDHGLPIILSQLDLDDETLQVIKDQYSRLRYQGQDFNTDLINELIGKKIPLFKQFTLAKRRQLFKIAQYTTYQQPSEQGELALEKLKPEAILVLLNGTLTIETTSPVSQPRNNADSSPQSMKQDGSKTQSSVIQPGMSIAVQHLHWLKNSLPEGSTFKFIGSQALTVLEFSSKELAQLVYRPVLESLTQKLKLIENVDVFNGDSIASQQRLEKLSPYIMFVMAALCKVQVYNMSELITVQGKTPGAMYVILEGQAKAIYEDTLERKGEVCPYSRRSIRTDLPKEFKFGLHSFTAAQSSAQSLSPKSHGRSETSPKESKATLASSQHVSPRSSITYQNLVFNQKWSEHQPAKLLSYRQHIEFGFLSEGQYIGSRIILDDGALKNFIKVYRANLKEWVKPQVKSSGTLNQTLMAGFVEAKQQSQRQLHDQAKNSSDESHDDEPIEDHKVTFHHKDTSFNMSMRKTVMHQIEEGREYQEQRNYLLQSQLSIIVTSRTLKAMVFYKKDKAYFHEPVKKLLTEIIQDKNFLDLDRPLEQGNNIELIRRTQKQWEQYKVRYEEHSLRESFHQKYQVYPR